MKSDIVLYFYGTPEPESMEETMKLYNDRISKVGMMAEIAIYIALSIIVTRMFSISLLTMRFSFTFLVYLVCGLRLGPLPAFITGFLADLVGILLFPSGPPHLGLSLVSGLSAACYGVFFFEGKFSIKKLILFILIEQFVLHSLLNTYWVSQIINVPMKILLYKRIPQQLSMATLKIVGISFVLNSPIIERLKK